MILVCLRGEVILQHVAELAGLEHGMHLACGSHDESFLWAAYLPWRDHQLRAATAISWVEVSVHSHICDRLSKTTLSRNGRRSTREVEKAASAAVGIPRLPCAAVAVSGSSFIDWFVR